VVIITELRGDHDPERMSVTQFRVSLFCDKFTTHDVKHHGG